jgi:hypothetical protein
MELIGTVSCVKIPFAIAEAIVPQPIKPTETEAGMPFSLLVRDDDHNRDEASDEQIMSVNG